MAVDPTINKHAWLLVSGFCFQIAFEMTPSPLGTGNCRQKPPSAPFPVRKTGLSLGDQSGTENSPPLPYRFDQSDLRLPLLFV